MSEHFDSSDQEQVDRRRQKRRDYVNERKRATLEVMNTKLGRRFVWELLEECGVFRVSMSGGNSQTFFREGERNIGLKLIARINAEAGGDLFLRMQRENMKPDTVDVV